MPSWFPGAVHNLVFLAAIGALVFSVNRFTITVRRIVAVVQLGQTDPTRSNDPNLRWRTLAIEALGHTRMRQWQKIGIAHMAVFFGFFALVLTLITAFGHLRNPEWALPIIGHWGVYDIFNEIFGMATFAGIIALTLVRQRNLPKKLGRDSRFYGSTMWQAYYIEATIAAIGFCVLVLRGLEGAYVGVYGYSLNHLFTYPIAKLLHVDCADQLGAARVAHCAVRRHQDRRLAVLVLHGVRVPHHGRCLAPFPRFSQHLV